MSKIERNTKQHTRPKANGTRNSTHVQSRKEHETAHTSKGERNAYTKGENAYTKGENAYTKGENAYTKGENAYTKRKNAYTKGENAYTKGENAYTKGENAYTKILGIRESDSGNFAGWPRAAEDQ